VDQPRRRLDPLALTVLSAALAAIVGIAAFLIYRVRSDTPSAQPPVSADEHLREAIAEVRKWIEDSPRSAPPQTVKPAPVPPAPAPPPPKPLAVVPPPSVPTGFELTDARPPKDKRDFDPGDEYGFVVAGDAQFVPDRVTVLRERLTTKAAKQLEGKRIQVVQLVTWYVRTPKGATVEAGPGLPRMPVEKAFDLPEIRKYPYWVICSIGVTVDGHYISARGTDGFGGNAPDFAAHHRRALLRAIDQVIAALPQTPVAAAASSAPKPFMPVVYQPDPGHTWRYKVVVEPELWREATLTYHTVLQGSALGVTTQFRHAGGQMDFNLGVFAPAHPSHANVRFPGFFFHPAYLDRPLVVGQRFTWEWPWQLPGGQVRAGRLKRYTGELAGWDDIAIANGRYPAARIEATLSYIDEGRVQASAKETIWYMPAVRQLARIVREGRTPDEGATRIVAELLEYR